MRQYIYETVDAGPGLLHNRIRPYEMPLTFANDAINSEIAEVSQRSKKVTTNYRPRSVSLILILLLRLHSPA